MFIYRSIELTNLSTIVLYTTEYTNPPWRMSYVNTVYVTKKTPIAA